MVATGSNTARVAGKFWLLTILLVTATLIAYTPVWHAGFIWDDADHLTDNPLMTAPHGLRMIWSSVATSRYYPLTLTTFWVEHRLWGFNPLPYHLVNIALHALSGVLIFLVLLRLRVTGAWLAAMLWVLHPVNVESVAWVAELKNTQSAVFCFMSVLCFLRFQAQGKLRWYALAVLCGVAAMLSKPSTVVLPLVLLLCVWWQQRRWRLTDILQVSPLFLVSCFLSARTVVEQRGQIIHVATPEWNLGMAGRFAVAGKAIWFYAAKVLWPVRLSFMYPLWKVQPDSLLSWLPLAGLIVLGILLWMWRGAAWARAGLFGGGYFVVALLPVLGFFDVFYFRYSFVADHFQYLASLGLIALVASAVATICERTGRRGRQIGAAVSATALLMLGLLTWEQTCSFKNGETLWRRALASYPNSWGPHFFWGMMLRESGHLSEAVDHLDQAVQLNPDAYDAHNNLGNALVRAGKTQDAISQYVQALRLKPDYAKAHINYGNALLLQGKVQEAISHYEQALRIKPDLAEAHYDLGIASEQAGSVQEAIRHYEQALRLKPDFAEAQNGLARLQAGH